MWVVVCCVSCVLEDVWQVCMWFEVVVFRVVAAVRSVSSVRSLFSCCMWREVRSMPNVPASCQCACIEHRMSHNFAVLII